MASVKDRLELPARIFTAPATRSILRLSKRQWDWRSLGHWTAANISYFLPKRYTVRAGTRKSPEVNGAEDNGIIVFEDPDSEVVVMSHSWRCFPLSTLQRLMA